jgi:hypothetical protein
MLQEIIVYIILAITLGIVIYKSIGFFDLFKNKNTSACHSCASGSCGSCAFHPQNNFSNQISPLKFGEK